MNGTTGFWAVLGTDKGMKRVDSAGGEPWRPVLGRLGLVEGKVTREIFLLAGFPSQLDLVITTIVTG